MQTADEKKISIKARIKAPVEVAWKCWTSPEDIMRWNNASPDWHTPRAENDLRVGGSFIYRMESKDGKFGFDFGGVYTSVKLHKQIAYSLGDGRKVEVTFSSQGPQTEIEEKFEAEGTNPIEIQRKGWQAILDNFALHTETSYIKNIHA
jgi:uncharacterized protein YndB with AHSA1/START domain